MIDPRITKLSQLLTNYCVKVQRNDVVVVRTALAAMPLAKEAYRAVLQAGGHPHIFIKDEGLEEIFLKEGNDEQLAMASPLYSQILNTFDCMISIRGSENTRRLSNIDPKKQQKMAMANRDLMATYMRRSAAGDFRWVGTLFPTQAHAQDADMSLDEFEDFVYGACFLEEADPIASWQAMNKRQQILCDWLETRDQLRVTGPNVDLTLSVKGRKWINSDGKRNMPSGEIFTGPVEQSVNGWIRYTYPAIYQGREVEGVELQFEDGKVVKATAKKNEEFLRQVLDTDAGARYLGEFAIGTNRNIQKFTRSILFDEKINGTIHMAVGKSYPESGGRNESSVHWDMICDMQDGGQIWGDGELFYDSGRFLLLNE